MADQYNHVVYGTVTVVCRYADFWMAVVDATGENRAIYEADCRPIQPKLNLPLQPVEVAEPVLAEPVLAEAATVGEAMKTLKAEAFPAIPVEEAPSDDRSGDTGSFRVDVNSFSAAVLAKTFPVLSKTAWRQVKGYQASLDGGTFASFEQFGDAVKELIEKGLITELTDLSPLRSRLSFEVEGA